MTAATVAARVVRPVHLILLGFFGVIMIGTVLLLLPISAAPGVTTTWHDALFTATSASCVTGLITLDTATHWSPFGLAVIAVLIQIGGLGVMSLATMIGLLVIGRVGLRSTLFAAAEGRAMDLGDVKRIVSATLLLSFTVEATAAVILTADLIFRHGFTWKLGVGHGVFLAISAFNNAGFAPYTDNVMGFTDDPVMLLVLAGCFIIGGLGFPVLVEIVRRAQARAHDMTPPRASLTMRLALTGTATLITIGWVSVAAIEWRGALAGMSIGEKLLNSFFQGVTPRTAGFNSVDYALMHDSTLAITDVLMFIGGSSGGTAGGVKITTMAVIFAAVFTEVRANPQVVISWRAVPQRVVSQALVVITVATFAVVVAAISLMLLNEGIPTDKIVFETVSAFGTVGLSTGITAQITVMSQMVLIVLMFLGRVGTVTLVSALAGQEIGRQVEYVEQRPLIG